MSCENDGNNLGIARKRLTKRPGNKGLTCIQQRHTGIETNTQCRGNEDPGALKLDATKSLSQSQGAHDCEFQTRSKVNDQDTNRLCPRTGHGSG